MSLMFLLKKHNLLGYAGFCNRELEFLFFEHVPPDPHALVVHIKIFFPDRFC